MNSVTTIRPTPRVYSTQRLNSNDQLTRTFAALADPTRRAMLRRLARGDATVTQLAEPFPVTLQAISKHLRVLEEARLVVRRRGSIRPTKRSPNKIGST